MMDPFNKKKIIKEVKKWYYENNAILEKKLLTMENTNDSRYLCYKYTKHLFHHLTFLNNLINNNDSSVGDFYIKQSGFHYN